MELLWRSSHISGGNATYVEDLYEVYLMDPNGVPEEWRAYFDSLPRVNGSTLQDVPHSTVKEHFAQISKMRVRTEATVQHDSQATEYERKQVQVLQLISAALGGHRGCGGGVGLKPAAGRGCLACAPRARRVRRDPTCAETRRAGLESRCGIG